MHATPCGQNDGTDMTENITFHLMVIGQHHACNPLYYGNDGD